MLSNARYYHKITRNAVIAFGSLFSNIYIQRTNSAGEIAESINVPLMYSKKQKFMTSILYKQDSENRQFKEQLPKMGFEIVAYTHSPQRKMTSNQVATKYVSVPATVPPTPPNSIGIDGSSAYEFASSNPPVPYTLTFNLYIATKNQDDVLQIIEQILPYFNPTHSLPVVWIPELGIEADFPITLTGVNPYDAQDLLLSTRDEVVWVLTFDANVNFYGAIRARSIIKTVNVGIYGNMDTTLPQTPTVEYTASVSPISAGPNDNYTFMEGWSE